MIINGHDYEAATNTTVRISMRGDSWAGCGDTIARRAAEHLIEDIRKEFLGLTDICLSGKKRHVFIGPMKHFVEDFVEGTWADILKFETEKKDKEDAEADADKDDGYCCTFCSDEGDD